MHARHVTRFLCAVITLLMVLVMSAAFASTINIQTNPDDPDNSFEIRNLTLPDGSETKYYVIKSSPVTLTIDEKDQLIADHIEIDADNRLVRIIGFGTFTSGSETIQGQDLIIELEDNTFSGNDVLIVTDAIDVLGVDATRVPGQISVVSGSFSPCRRCGQEVEDYGFNARRLELYPGDRLVAFDVNILIRERESFWLPVLVVPLGPPNRQPKLAITQGTESERAEVALDFPYVSGATAYGTFSVRYYADVTPGEGNFFSNGVLGGSVDTSYLGGGFYHQFYTPQGAGTLEFFYTPAFVEYSDDVAIGKDSDAFLFRFLYETDDLEGFTSASDSETDDFEDDVSEESGNGEVATDDAAPGSSAGEPQLSFLIERDDEERQRLVEYRVSMLNTFLGVQGEFFTQGFFDLRQDDIDEPSYNGRNTPLRTFGQLSLDPLESSYTVGPFELSNLHVDVGVFEDSGNPFNRSATGSATTTAARLREQHTLTLNALSPWQGLSISGQTSFEGQYYSTAERAINWDSDLNVRQAFGDAASFSVSFNRLVNEGETPFQFDDIDFRKRTDVVTSFNLTPLPWLDFSVDETYVLVDDRNPDELGAGPITSELRLFNNLTWISLQVENNYDIAEKDPGELSTELELRSPASDLQGSLRVTHVQDLNPSPDRLTGALNDDTETTVELEYGLAYLSADFSGGYDYYPDLLEEDETVKEFWKPFELGLTLGSMDQEDRVPGFRLSYSRNLNTHTMEELGLEFSVRFGHVEALWVQYFDFEDARLGTNEYTLTLQNVLQFQASGFAIIPASWVSLELDETATQTWAFSLEDDLERSDVEWRVTYSTLRDPTLTDDAGEVTGGFRNSQLQTFVNVEAANVGPVLFGVDFDATLYLRDDVVERTYLRESNLDLFADVAGRVGVQGGLEYTGVLSGEEVTRAELSFDEFAITVALFDELYVSTVFNDVWDFSGNNDDNSPFNFQPELRVAWNRCCWALYGSWDTMTGAVSITLTTPGGGSDGFQQGFDSGLTLPGRDNE